MTTDVTQLRYGFSLSLSLPLSLPSISSMAVIMPSYYSIKTLFRPHSFALFFCGYSHKNPCCFAEQHFFPNFFFVFFFFWWFGVKNHSRVYLLSNFAIDSTECWVFMRIIVDIVEMPETTCEYSNMWMVENVLQLLLVSAAIANGGFYTCHYYKNTYTSKSMCLCFI